MQLPNYVLGITVYDTDGTTGLANIKVTIKNERTNNTLSANSASDGSAVFDCANFTSGVVTGDVITYFCLYTDYDASGQHTVTEGGADVTLTLTAKPSYSNLRYFTVIDFYDFLGYDTTESDLPKATQVVSIGRSVESEIDNICNRKFDSNTATNEYHDGLGSSGYEYFLDNLPIISITTLSTTQNDEDTDSASVTWDSLTADDDYFLDSNTGKISITDDTYNPIKGRNRLKCTYTYGASTVPQDIKKVAILMTAKTMGLMSNDGRNMIDGRNSGTAAQIANFQNEIDRILKVNRRESQYLT